jgi:hypothetical protein
VPAEDEGTARDEIDVQVLRLVRKVVGDTERMIDEASPQVKARMLQSMFGQLMRLTLNARTETDEIATLRDQMVTLMEQAKGVPDDVSTSRPVPVVEIPVDEAPDSDDDDDDEEVPEV